ncbi:hypothetical protein [Cellulomonas sp. KRMCY2]|uniref:hypothetical protein n=1 Tax=Cellulomonas sp. KRMCY2 TaxID=1304865 RepID=UPI00045E5A15|nr:hypothetical protein [Cellulomonas sp. KRMCY2]
MGWGDAWAAEELSDQQVAHIVDANLLGSVRLIRASRPARTGRRARDPDLQLRMLDAANGLAPGDPARMAAAIIASVDVEPAPLRMVLGSQALDGTVAVLRERIVGFEAQRELAASTDVPPGE